MDPAKRWLENIRDLPDTGPVRVLNVCGGHERTLAAAGVRSLLPDHVQLIPGPGCPVCVCPEEDLFDVIHLSLNEAVTVAAFGDMLRVPCNAPRGAARTLEQARSQGADIKAVASPMEVVTLALQQQKPVVFFAVGFETTMAPVAAMMHAGVPGNLFVFTSGRRTWPAVAALLKNNNSGFDAMVCPGHVATIMGADEWGFVPQQYGKPAAIAGFTAERLLAATYVVLKQRLDGEARLVNSYDQLVTGGGNPTAQRIINDVFAIADVPWRGMGTLPDSGYVLQPAWQAHDARLRFAETLRHGGARRREGQMPPGCACGEVVSGQKYPTQCTLYGRPCTPQNPVGPCMVSDEGACQIWWKAGLHKQKRLYA